LRAAKIAEEGFLVGEGIRNRGVAGVQEFNAIAAST
jgi:hypothetical protein